MKRFWDKVDQDGPVPTDALATVSTPCWLWRASKDRDGYGGFGLEGKWLRAHRLAYELACGPIPDGMLIDHLCRRPSCVRPDHLDLVNNRENVLRGVSPGATAIRTDVCKYGHSDWYDRPPSTRNGRNCRICQRESSRRYRARQEA